MKKLIPLLSVILFTFFCLFGCNLGSYRDNPVSDNKNDAQNGNISDSEQSEERYTVTVYYNNAVFKTNDEITVVWQGEDGSVLKKLNPDGTADAGVLDGDYSIYLLGLPDKYSYNPNIYKATDSKRHVDIFLVSLRKPLRGDGGIHASSPNMAVYQGGGCFVINKQGAYRVQCKKGQFYYFEYEPTDPGIYYIRSWANVYEDEVNPILQVWEGNVGFKWLGETIDGGGDSLKDGYTKNFRYVFKVPQSELRNTYTFGVSAESKTEQYPVTVEFEIICVKDYIAGYEINNPPVQATEIDKIETTPETSANYIYADEGTKLFNSKGYRYDEQGNVTATYDRIKYDEENGVYRIYDEEKYSSTGGYGPYLCCELQKEIPCYSTTTLYEANFVGLGDNYLKLFIWDEELEDYIYIDYTDFIRVDYASKCNSAGVCYVTKELKEFLQLFAINHTLWTDGVNAPAGSPEDNGYDANQDDLWLFACGYYDEVL